MGGCRAAQQHVFVADPVLPAARQSSGEVVAAQFLAGSDQEGAGGATAAEGEKTRRTGDLPDPGPKLSSESDQPKKSGVPEEIDPQPALRLLPDPEESEGERTDALQLYAVAESVRLHFPLVQAAVAARTIAAGERIAASGAFDHKLEGYSESQPLGFYENDRSQIGLKRDTTWGGTVFGGYRIGRGDFEPWYLERETNKGGEFKLGMLAPLAQGVWTDPRRAELWRAQIEQRRVEPEIQTQVIAFVREGSFAYWDWVAAGAMYRVADKVLNLAVERTRWLEAQVKAEQKAEIDLVDNRRSIVSREAKLVDARRKLEQSAVKLSLYFRDPAGAPLLAGRAMLPEDFPEPRELAVFNSGADAEVALGNRPELAELRLVRRQLQVALQQAGNERLPEVMAGVNVSEDVGPPTSEKRDKSPAELEALVTLSVPLERRKAIGKVTQLRGKIVQVAAKNRFTEDKIVAEVGLARAALRAAQERVVLAREGRRLAERMREAERVLFEEDQSTLFNLNLREGQLAEAEVELVVAQLEYHLALADYTAALGYDRPGDLASSP